MHLAAPPAAVFPLLCPVREHEWIASWSCDLLFTRSGTAELDCVFRTHFADDGPADTWVVSRYEPPTRIEFIRVNALRAMRYAITLTPTDGGGTRAEWQQVLTALDEAGERFVAQLDDAAFVEKIRGLERLLDHFLATGERPPPAAPGPR